MGWEGTQQESTPLLSIAIPTYDRPEMLRECLGSILDQGTPDLEVIVGNDCPERILSRDSMGIYDSRLRFVNHPRRLGARRNHQALLRFGRGRYFTWLADDDLLLPGFLNSIERALRTYGYPPCVFTGYALGERPPDIGAALEGAMELLDGREFLVRYLSGRCKVVGTYGVFERGALERLGGMDQFSDGFAPYADNLLAIRAAGLSRIVFIDAPLVFVRAHTESASWTSGDFDVYRRAQEYMCRRSVDVFRREQLRADFDRNLYLLLRWCTRDILPVAQRAGQLDPGEIVAYVGFLLAFTLELESAALRCRAAGMSVKTVARLVRLLKRPSRLHRRPAIDR